MDHRLALVVGRHDRWPKAPPHRFVGLGLWALFLAGLVSGCDNPYWQFVGAAEPKVQVTVSTWVRDLVGVELGGFAPSTYSFRVYPLTREPDNGLLYPIKFRGTFVTDASGKATISVPSGMVRVSGAIGFAGPPKPPMQVQQSFRIDAQNTKIQIGGQLDQLSPTSTGSLMLPTDKGDPWGEYAPRFRKVGIGLGSEHEVLVAL